MTEREKMQNRKLYDANDRSLCADRVRAKELCHAYNQLWPSDEAGKREILRRLLAKTGEDFCVTAPFWCDYGYNIRLGEHFYANHNLVILDCAAVTFGDHVFVAPNCGFYTAGHPIDAARRGVQVMPGVTIGSNVVIGGGSVVVRDIPSDSVAVGNPCRAIRPITEADKQTCWDR